MPQSDLFHLWIADVVQPLRVVRFHGTERISAPFCFELVALTQRRPVAGGASPVGRRAMFVFGGGDGAPPRSVRGVLASWKISGHAHRDEFFVVHATLRPRLALLKHRKDTRIFQDLSVVEVVRAVLARYQIPLVARLSERYPALEYCVQYNESDLAFVQRILAEHGIFYWLAAADEVLADGLAFAEAVVEGTQFGGATLGGGMLPDEVAPLLSAEAAVVLADVPQHYPAHGESLPLDPAALLERTVEALTAPSLRYARELVTPLHTGAEVTEFALRNTVAPGAVALRGFDFEKPFVPHVAGAETTRDDDPAQTEAASAEPLEHYDHHDEYGRAAVSRRGARRHRERLRAATLVGEGRSLVPSLAVGRRFVLEGHPLEELNQEYALAEVAHQGELPEFTDSDGAAKSVYANTFRCVPAAVPLRPRVRKKRAQQSLETAMVVGPAGEEIYTDEFGRIKVQFHWDREGARDEHSSCWIRVAQAWAGPGRGAQFVPRIGDEVLVAYLEGDTDRPMVIGSVYNGAAPQPFGLPAEKSKSGFRTRSTPESEGFNELSFEDGRGVERVYLHAQRDWDELVEQDHSREVRQDERLLVRRDRRERVLRDREAVVEGSLRDTVAGHAAYAVNGSRAVSVGGDQTSEVGGRATVTVRRGFTGTYDKGALQVYTEGLDVVAMPWESRYVEGVSSTYVDGRLELTASSSLLVSCPGSVTIVCGESSITLSSDKITLKSAAIELVADGATQRLADDKCEVKVSSAVTMVSDDKIALKGSGSILALTGDAALDGGTVKLKSSASASVSTESSSATPTTIELVDGDGAPLPGRRYRVLLGGGKFLDGLLDKDGKATLDLEGSAKVVFPDLEDVQSA